MNSKSQSITSSQPLGVIDTLSAGLAVVARHPWLLLLPVLFDLFLWVAPPLTLGQGLIGAISAPFDPQGANSALMQEEFATEVPLLYQSLQEQLRGLNLWSLAISPLLFWPTVAAGQPPAGAAALPLAAYPLDRPGTALTVGLGLALAGLLVNVLWLQGVVRGSRGLRGWRGNLLPRLQDALRQGLRLLLIGLLLLAALFGLLLPLSLGLAVVTLVVPGVGSLLSSIVTLTALWLSIWVALHLYFTVAAVVVADQGVWQAPWLSVALVRRNFGSAFGLIVLNTLLLWGFGLIWLRLGSTQLGFAASIVGNAALGTAVAAATMIFFAQRVQMENRE